MEEVKYLKGTYVKIDNSARGTLMSLFGAMNMDGAKHYVDDVIKETKESLIKEVRYKISAYDEEYISEDVRHAINRMKHELSETIDKI